MSDAVVTLLAGLGGALIGATAAVGGQMLANRHARRADRRREAVELVAQFWAVAEQLWATTESLDYTIVDLIQKRLELIADRKAAYAQARFLIAQMRLLYPSVAKPAEALMEASSNSDHKRQEEQREARRSALYMYEIAAGRLLAAW